MLDREVLTDIAEDSRSATLGRVDNVLLVTHGDIVAQWVEITTGETVMECGYCGWVVSSAPTEHARPMAAAYERVAQDSVMAMNLG